MDALRRIEEWGPRTPAARPCAPDGIAGEHGPAEHVFRWASVMKLATALAVLVAVEEGVVELEDAAGPEGATVRHLLAHASGLPFEDGPPIARPGRVYSSQGFEALAAHVAANAEMPVRAVPRRGGAPAARPRGRAARLAGADVHGTLRDARRSPMSSGADARAEETLAEATTVVFPGLAGVLPGIGRFDPLDWGLEFELKDAKPRHWTRSSPRRARSNTSAAPETFLWVDPEHALALVVLTDREFGDWALAAWPALSDAVASPGTRAEAELSSSGRSRLGEWPAPRPSPAARQDLGRQPVRRPPDVLDVLGADDDERGSGDRPQPLDRLGLGPHAHDLIVQEQLQLVRAQRHRLSQLAHLRRRLGPSHSSACCFAAPARSPAASSAPPPPRSPRPPPTTPSRGCSSGHETLDELRPGEHQLERDAAAEGAADDGDRSVEQRRDVVDVGDRPRLQRRVAVAREVGCDDAVAGGPERFDLRCPHPPVGDARVEEEDVHSSTNSGRSSSSKVARSLATTAGVTARTNAVRGIRIAGATSPNQSRPRRRRRRVAEALLAHVQDPREDDVEARSRSPWRPTRPR